MVMIISGEWYIIIKKLVLALGVGDGLTDNAMASGINLRTSHFPHLSASHTATRNKNKQTCLFVRCRRHRPSPGIIRFASSAL